MTLVLVAAAATAAASWWLNTRAADAAAEAVAATERAAWAKELRAEVRAYLSQTADLVLALHVGESPEISAQYGDIPGVERRVADLLASANELLDSERAEALHQDWDLTQAGSVAWVNAESEAAERPLRLSLTERGLRATTAGTSAVPQSFKGMTVAQKRLEVRSVAEALTEGTLRRIARDAEVDARNAQEAADGARRSADLTTLVLLVVNAVVALTASIWLYGTIARPLAEAQAVASRVAAGDFAATFPPASRDEVGALLTIVESMRDAVVSKIEALQEVAGAVLITSESLHACVARASELSHDDEGLPRALEEIDASSQLLNDLAMQMIGH